MKWWWSPRRRRAWLRQEALYRDARWDLWLMAAGDPGGHEARLARCEALKPEGWTREIEAYRWDACRPARNRAWLR